MSDRDELREEVLAANRELAEENDEALVDHHKCFGGRGTEGLSRLDHDRSRSGHTDEARLEGHAGAWRNERTARGVHLHRRKDATLLAPRFLLTLPLLALAAFPLPTHAASVSPTVRSIRLPDNYQNIPAEFRGTVAWSGQRKSSYVQGTYHPQPNYLYTSPLRHFRPRLVATSKPGFAMIQVHLSQRWLVWEDQSVATPEWSIWAMNRQSGKQVLIDSSAKSGRAPHPQDFPLLSLQGDTIAWTPAVCPHNDCVQGLGVENWASVVRMKHLPFGPVKTIASTRAPCHLWWPSLAAHALVWEQIGTCHGVTGADVLLYDRADHTTRVLTATHRALTPTTDGRYVAWNEARPPNSGQGTIMLLDRESGRITVASDLRLEGGCTEGASKPFVCDVEPVLAGGVLGWSANGGSVMMALDLKTRHRYVVPTGKRGFDHLGPSTGRRLVWNADVVPQNGSTHRTYIGVADVP